MVRNASGDLMRAARLAGQELIRRRSRDSASSPLIMDLSTWLGRNTSTRRGAMGTSVPVFGLRPMRWDFWRTAKVPKEESFTVSPLASASHTSSSMSSTICADSLRDRPTAWNTASARSARVKVLVVMENRLPRRRRKS
jgi:hypothetical protein